MVISHLFGGLGNQMFQYAAGRALAISRGTDFFLDISDLLANPQHQGFELSSVFVCPIELAEARHMRSVLGWQFSKKIQHLLQHPLLSAVRTRHFVTEPSFDYWPGFRELPPDVYLRGYWQSESYFLDIADIIRNDFRFSRPLTGDNLKYAKDIVETNSVSLHVRRGDYVSNPKAFSVHGVCPIEYFQNATKYVADRVMTPKFFVFSDDMDWARSHLKIGHPCCFVDCNNGASSYIDMHLMSQCKHNIIANSSFSWWGAWLNADVNKIVVAPKRWFANKSETPDLIPSAWISL